MCENTETDEPPSQVSDAVRLRPKAVCAVASKYLLLADRCSPVASDAPSHRATHKTVGTRLPG